MSLTSPPTKLSFWALGAGHSICDSLYLTPLPNASISLQHIPSHPPGPYSNLKCLEAYLNEPTEPIEPYILQIPFPLSYFFYSI